MSEVSTLECQQLRYTVVVFFFIVKVAKRPLSRSGVEMGFPG